MKNILLSFSVVLFCFLGFFLAVAYFAPTQKTVRLKTKDFALQLYKKSWLTKPSIKTEAPLSGVIQQRLECYSNSPIERIENCNSRYLENIIIVGREKIYTPPDLGLFIPAVRYCPIVYNICMGYKNDSSACIVEETQCIDNAYDRFWRGAFLSQQE